MVAVVLGAGSVSVFAGELEISGAGQPVLKWLFKHPFVTMQSTVGIDHAMAAHGYYQDYERWDEA